MLRTALVIVHAGAGVAGLFLGLPALSPPGRDGRHAWYRRLYAASVGVLLVAMVALVALDWPGLDPAARAAFSGLAGLGALMAYRLVRARREARERRAGWDERYIGHVYFTYVSLWIGFLVVPALNLPHPHLAVPLVPAVVLGVGHALVGRHKRRVLPA